MEVAIVSSNAETIDGLRSYLRSAGVIAHGMGSIEDFVQNVPSSIDAFVLFPDDFRWESVLSAIAERNDRFLGALPVLVTGHPKRFEALALGEPVLVVPRPVWGWKILDAIRAHAETA